MEKPDIIITDETTYQEARSGKKVVVEWPTFAAKVFPRLQEEIPELRQFTLEQFVEHCPCKFEIFEEDEK